MMRASVSVTVSPSNGRCPVTIWYIMQPNDQISVRWMDQGWWEGCLRCATDGLIGQVQETERWDN
jgi:hypothetical protein